MNKLSDKKKTFQPTRFFSFTTSKMQSQKTLSFISLFALVVQNTLLVLLMRHSRTIDGEKYLASTAVLLAEVLKVIICVTVVLVENPNQALSNLFQIVLSSDVLKLSIPSGLYAIQNNLLYIALSNLEAAPYQVIYQLKVITTALFSVVMLNKKLVASKWFSLLLLMIGVALVQLSLDRNTERQNSHPNLQNPLLGLAAVLASCITSGFAGVYFEKILKGTSPTLWVRNIQLGIFGILFSGIYMVVNDYEPLLKSGFFQGYNTITVLVVIIQAVGGLIIALVVKYADNILKGFGSGISIVLSSVISIYLFDFQPTMKFIVGALLVVIAVYIYSLPSRESEKAVAPTSPQARPSV
eukprot:TRINITY_DN6279_c0_g1_i1.p1 TRINITY_DN6279_c0_g1~~TRINITY_DN6279_c0_g1_i1.p1  ORF type:complete len:354 (-),score=34.41 TRINITY_DN6279_c0_g1_i1:203-1264(-)